MSIRSMGVGSKLALGFGAVIALLLCVVLIYHLTLTYVSTEFGSLLDGAIMTGEEASELQNGMLMCRRHEKDFLLRKDTKYIEQHKDQMVNVHDRVKRLGVLAVKTKQNELSDTIEAIEKNVTLYEESIAALTAAEVRIGLDEKSGLKGAFRSAVQDLEESLEAYQVEDLRVALLMLRRWEKDFVRTKDAKYREQLVTTIEEYRQSLQKGACEAGSRDTQLRALSQYAQALAAYMAAYEAGDTGAQDTTYDQVRAHGQTMEEALAQSYIGHALETLLMIRRHEKDFLLRQDETYATRNATAVADLRQRMRSSAVLAVNKDRLLQNLDVYEKGFKEVVVQTAAVASATAVLRDAAHKVEPLVEEINKAAKGMVASQRTSTDDVVSSRSATALALGAVTAAVAIIFAFLIARSIRSPLRNVATRLMEIAEGRADLSQRVEIESKDEIGNLADSFNRLAETMNEMARISQMIAAGDLTAKVDPKSDRDVLGIAFANMVKNLSNTVGQVMQTAEQVRAASGDVATTAQQSSVGAQQQQKGVEQISTQTAEVSTQMEEVSSQIEEMASGIEQASATVDSQVEFVSRVSSTMEEMGVSVQSVSENASKAQSQGQNAVDEAVKGREAVNAATRGMDEISDTIDGLAGVIGSLGQRSNQIGEIVDTITGIASQTNLLALNAAIEAARAGEHGRGFAVVADEVRKLAERTAQATDEIETLVKGIQDESQNAVKSTEEGIKKVKQGGELTANVGTVLQSVVGSIQDTSEAIRGILASTDEQTKASRDVTTAIGELSSMSKQIAKGMSEQSKGAQQISQAVAQTAKAMEETAASVEEISGVTNEVAAGAQEMASSAEELSAQSDGLRKLMAQFTISSQQGGAVDVGAQAPRSADQQPAQHYSWQSESRDRMTPVPQRRTSRATGEDGSTKKASQSYVKATGSGGNGGDAK